MRTLCGTLSVLLLSSALAAAAEEVPVYVMDIPPMASKDGGHGVVGEIVLEAMKRARLTPRLIFMPKNRAILTVQLPTSRDELILPLARLPERDPHFTWIAQLYHAERGFFTTGAQIRSYEQARTTLGAVAVARGTANVTLLREQGFKPEQIFEISLNDDVPRMLLAGRIQAWFGPLEEMQVYLRDEPRRGQIVAGTALSTTDNYLACSKQCSPALVARLTAELGKMEKDGSMKAIRHKYASQAREGWP